MQILSCTNEGPMVLCPVGPDFYMLCYITCKNLDPQDRIFFLNRVLKNHVWFDQTFLVCFIPILELYKKKICVCLDIGNN